MLRPVVPLFRPLVRQFGDFTPEIILSEANLRKTAVRFARERPTKKQEHIAHPNFKNAAVLIPLCVINDKVSLLYTLRAPNLKTHRGQVAFPGGIQECGEDLEETALRETEEELGIDRGKIVIWGQGNTIIARGATGVLPVIGQITTPNVMREIKMNPTEVSEAFAVPLEALCDRGQIRHTQFRGDYSVPVYMGGRNRIWGLTAMITHMFLNALLPKTVYNHQIKYIGPVKGGHIMAPPAR